MVIMILLHHFCFRFLFIGYAQWASTGSCLIQFLLTMPFRDVVSKNDIKVYKPNRTEMKSFFWIGGGGE